MPTGSIGSIAKDSQELTNSAFARFGIRGIIIDTGESGPLSCSFAGLLETLMAQSSKRPATLEPPTGSMIAMLAERSQLDFELNFFGAIVGSLPDYLDALRVHANNLSVKGLVKESLKTDLKLAELRPEDPDIRYNLACRYAQLRQPDMAIETLRQAVELGFRDFRSLLQDRDLDSLRKDPRFRQLIREYADR